MASDLAKAGRSILLLGALCWDVSVLSGILCGARPGSSRPWLCWECILLTGAPLLSASRIQARVCQNPARLWLQHPLPQPCQPCRPFMSSDGLCCNHAAPSAAGRPGVGKTTAIRELSRLLADECQRRVVVVVRARCFSPVSALVASKMGARAGQPPC